QGLDLNVGADVLGPLGGAGVAGVRGDVQVLHGGQLAAAERAQRLLIALDVHGREVLMLILTWRADVRASSIHLWAAAVIRCCHDVPLVLVDRQKGPATIVPRRTSPPWQL